MNGKAKIDFTEWLEEDLNLKLYNVDSDPIYLNALIIEWLDSVGIYIEIGGADYRGIEFWYNIQERKTINGNNGEYFSTRQEATEKAIETAVNTYNNK